MYPTPAAAKSSPDPPHRLAVASGIGQQQAVAVDPGELQAPVVGERHVVEIDSGQSAAMDRPAKLDGRGLITEVEVRVPGRSTHQDVARREGRAQETRHVDPGCQLTIAAREDSPGRGITALGENGFQVRRVPEPLGDQPRTSHAAQQPVLPPAQSSNHRDARAFELAEIAELPAPLGISRKRAPDPGSAVLVELAHDLPVFEIELFDPRAGVLLEDL